MLGEGVLRDGTVIAVDARKGMVLVRTTHSAQGRGAVWCSMAAPFFGYFLGAKMYALPEPGAKVVIMGTSSEPIVLTVLPTAALVAEPPVEGPYSMDKSLVSMDSTSGNTTSPPADALPGDVIFRNALGVGLAIMRSMAGMSAGKRAAVECFLTEEMVRVISAHYKHLHAAGETEIFDNGGANRVELMASTMAEVLGRPPGDYVKAADGLGKITEGLFEQWRMMGYWGYAGDFVNYFFADPPKSNNAFQAGKLRVQAMSDGSLLVQSVADIAIERVTRIPVPRREGSAFKKNVNPSTRAGSNNTAYLSQNFDETSIKDTYLRIHQYARWLAQVRGMERFLQLENDFTVPSENETPDPSWACGEADKEAAIPDNIRYIPAYATIRIMRDGSIVLRDAHAHSLTMSATGVTLASASNLRLEASADIDIIAGRDTRVFSYKNLSLVSATGALLQKARQSLRALCEIGKIWLKSNAEGKAVILDASKNGSGVSVISGGGITIQNKNAGDVLISNLNKNGVTSVFGSELSFHGTENLIIRSAKAVAVSCSMFIAKTVKSWFGQGANLCKLESGTIKSRFFKAGFIQANMIAGKTVSENKNAAELNISEETKYNEEAEEIVEKLDVFVFPIPEQMEFPWAFESPSQQRTDRSLTQTALIADASVESAASEAGGGPSYNGYISINLEEQGRLQNVTGGNVNTTPSLFSGLKHQAVNEYYSPGKVSALKGSDLENIPKIFAQDPEMKIAL